MTKMSKNEGVTVVERLATEQELTAAIKKFEGEAYRNDAKRLDLATEAAHAALQAHLDAIMSQIAVAKRAYGL